MDGLRSDSKIPNSGIIARLNDQSWYFPLNIFLDPVDGRCTMDCTKLG